MSSISPYTCITCHVAFNNGELQRAHYKSDWHRYNLKRKVADLGPITADEFTEKVEAIQQQQQRSEKNNNIDNRTSVTCKDCGKAFTSENGLLNHIKSKKHIDTVAKHANLPVSYKKTKLNSMMFYLIYRRKIQLNIRNLQQIHQKNRLMK
jgi:pre-60S factor REI1